MKRLLAVMALLALAIPNVAVAREGRGDRQDQQQNAQQNGGNQENRGGRRGGGGPRGQGVPPAAQNANPAPAPQPPPQTQQRGRGNFQGRQAQGNPGPTYARPGNDNQRFDDDNRRGGNDRRFGNDNRRFDNDRRFDNNRRFDNDRGRFAGRNFGYQRYFGRNFNFRDRSYVAVRAPRFVYPRGYSYRRWSVGAFLPLLFLSDLYYVDWEYLGLPPPFRDTEWVRYGSDALLVDVYTGRVLDVAYGVFY